MRDRVMACRPGSALLQRRAPVPRLRVSADPRDAPEPAVRSRSAWHSDTCMLLSDKVPREEGPGKPAPGSSKVLVALSSRTGGRKGYKGRPVRPGSITCSSYQC